MKKNVFIAVVSHGHGPVIEEINCLPELSENFNVVVKSNIIDGTIREYCKKNDIELLDHSYGKGFGENNNIIFQYIKNHYTVEVNRSYFIVLNPDVEISAESINALIDHMDYNLDSLATINLFKDKDHTIEDQSLRNYLTFFGFVRSFLFNNSDSKLDKSTLLDRASIDWAAGSFLAFTLEHYQRLNGFDERYFMYCEDMDICYRSNEMGYKTIYYPSIKAVHYAKHASRKIFSKHFFWHVTSVLRFLWNKS